MIKNRKFVVLMNPYSGTSNKKNLQQKIESFFTKHQLDYSFEETNLAGNYQLLKEKIQTQKITDVVITGGDGTINNVIGNLKDQDVQFSIIPGGSGNGLALSAHIPKNTDKALQLILNGTATLIDAFTINNKFSCMLSGLGFDAQVAHDFAGKSRRGLITYTQQSLINFFKATPYLFEITVDDFTFFTDAFFISIANSNQFGNNFTIAPKASLQDGLLDIVIVQKMSKAKLPFAIMQQIRGNNKLQHLVDEMKQKNVVYFQTPKLTIKNPKLAPLHIDGDPVQTQEILNIEILKKSFRLVM
jgi:diacylglycerol kinase (ATP)